MNLQFQEFHCETQWEFYRNGKVALQLVATGEDPDTFRGEPIITATVNTEHRIELDEIIVKDYSENEGTIAVLIEAGIVQPDYSIVFVGHGCRCGRCRLTDAARIEAYGLKQAS